MRVNMHTHSVFCDGKDTPEETVNEAIRRGFEILGFSSHGHSPYDECSMSPEATLDYIREINRLKEAYKDQITIYLGIEEDKTCRIPSKDPYDFVIGSVHFVEKDGKFMSVDYSEEMMEQILKEFYHGSFLCYARAYYSEVTELAEAEEVDIIGHLDLLMKYNDKEKWIRFDDTEYLETARACIDAIGDRKIYEVNTGAMARGYRTMPYPHRTLLAYMKEKNLRLMLNSDCHDKTKLTCGYELSLRLLKETGFTELWILKNGRFQPADINLFH